MSCVTWCDAAGYHGGRRFYAVAMMLPVALLLLGALTAVLAPRLIARAQWREREPVVALWVWQCVVAGVLLCCVLAMALTGAAAWHLVRGHVFAPAPHAVVEAYALGAYGPWAPATSAVLALGGVWTVVMLVREVVRARARRRQRRAELLVRSPSCRARSVTRSGWWSWRATGPTPGGSPAPPLSS